MPRGPTPRPGGNHPGDTLQCDCDWNFQWLDVETPSAVARHELEVMKKHEQDFQTILDQFLVHHTGHCHDDHDDVVA